MRSKSKSATVGSALSRRAAKPPARRPRKAVTAPEVWEQGVQPADEHDGQIDRQRDVEGDAGRNRPPYCDDYN